MGKRNILDGMVALNEATEEAMKKKVQKIFFKIYFAKAYDSVDWDFLDHMSKNFIFCSKWVRECVSSAHASVLSNGPSKEFKLKRGLRKGDLLLPFLYLLVADGLSTLISKVVSEGLYEAAELGVNKIKVFHLQYADEIIFIGSTCINNAWTIHRIIMNFKLLSGLKINYD